LPAIKFLISENFANETIILVKNYLGLELEKENIVIDGRLFILFFFIFKFFFVAFAVYRQLMYLFNMLVSKCRYLYTGYIFMDYEEYTRINPSVLVRNVSLLVDRFNGTLQNCFVILTDCLLFFSIFGLLLYFDWKSTLIISGIFLFISSLYYFGTKKRFTDWGAQAAKYEALRFKFLYEGLSSMKDIKISNNLEFFVKSYTKYVSLHGMLSVMRNFVKTLPKLTFEILAVISLVVVGFVFISTGKPIKEFIPIAGVFAVSAFKILPAGNRILIAFQNLRFDLVSMKILNEEIKKNKENKFYLNFDKKKEGLYFSKEIKISNIYFEYKSSNAKILNNINLTIPKNSTIGIIGESGSGKSTLMDIIIGLLNPTKGLVSCDGVDIHKNVYSWYNNLGYVPQSIYLIDDTIAKNIAFGIEDGEIDIKRIQECIELAKLSEFVKNTKLGIETVVGDKGVRLSGGQIQRLGVARALYKKPEILFFDESTSSLDTKTEEEMMNSVNDLLTGITKIIISHRIVTLKNCDVIYYIKNGKIFDQGDYNKMSSIKYDKD
jgi:ABC-type bacteriocin/lantibiotic exporter with double-glycine peptidase domain